MEHKNSPTCGQTIVVYPRRLRAYLLKPLFELCRARTGLTLDQIAALSLDAIRVRRHFGELRLWNFIRKDTGRYYATEHGKNFVNGWAKAHEVLYTLNNKVVAAPDG